MLNQTLLNGGDAIAIAVGIELLLHRLLLLVRCDDVCRKQLVLDTEYLYYDNTVPVWICHDVVSCRAGDSIDERWTLDINTLTRLV